MALNSTHPAYDRYIADWTLMRDAYNGERVVKSKEFVYLPPTPGQVLDGALTRLATKPGYAGYKAYQMRARFPDYVSEAVERYIGMLHNKPMTVELPAGMEGLIEKATQDGESLQDLLRRMNEQQLVTGRLGLLLDFPPNPDPANPLPYIALYYGESIINWDQSADHVGVNALTMVVLNESGPTRIDNFEWRDTERYRVLMLGVQPTTQTADETRDTQPNDATENVGPKVYMQGVFSMTSGDRFDPLMMTAPMYRGKTLEQIPFVFVNSKDIVAEPDNPPMLGLGRLCMSIYRSEADYRYTLFMQGQDTLVTIGTVTQNGSGPDMNEPLRVGAGAHIGLDLNGDAKYIGIGAEGIEGQREALRDDRKEAESLAGAVVSPQAGKQESGDALTTRLAAQTASLTQIAQSSVAALQNILRVAAVWMGKDPEGVNLTPNLEFGKMLISGQEINQLMASRTMGAPLSLESIHGVMKDRGLAKFDYETELDKIAEEDLERAKRVAELPLPPAPPAPTPSPAPAGDD